MLLSGTSLVTNVSERGDLTTDQVIRLTHDIECAFPEKGEARGSLH